MVPASLNMTPASLKMVYATLKMTPASLDMRPATLKMTPESLDIVYASMKMTPATLKMVYATLNMTPATLKLRPASKIKSIFNSVHALAQVQAHLQTAEKPPFPLCLQKSLSFFLRTEKIRTLCKKIFRFQIFIIFG